MSDQNRNQKSNQKKKSNQKSSQQKSSQQDPQRSHREGQQTQGNQANENPSWRDDEAPRTDSHERTRSNRDRSSVAHDRGRESDTQNRSFGQTRESDELDSELEPETGIEDSDDEDIDGTGRRNR